jgi:hypothetical protein
MNVAGVQKPTDDEGVGPIIVKGHFGEWIDREKCGYGEGSTQRGVARVVPGPIS